MFETTIRSFACATWPGVCATMFLLIPVIVNAVSLSIFINIGVSEMLGCWSVKNPPGIEMSLK